MPQPPLINPSVEQISESLFSELAARLNKYPGETYPLHVGDTWITPPEGCLMENISIRDYPDLYWYPPTSGIPSLINRIAGRMTEKTGIDTAPENIVVTSGATGGIASVLGAILSPSDELLIPAPYWPLITGIVRVFNAAPVIIPFFGRAESPESAVDLLERNYSPRTVALYLNSPNNPTGQVLPASWLKAMTEWAAQKNLWIISDEVYEQYVYEGVHTYCRKLAPERTFAIYSFSKAFGLSSNRCGYVVGPPEVIKQIKKVNTHTCYSASTASQIAGDRVLGGLGDRWVDNAHSLYKTTCEEMATRLGVRPPMGGQFLFIDIADALRGSDLYGFLERCLSLGLLVTPGTFFGPYPTHIRLCFTGVPPERVRRGVDKLVSILHESHG